LMVSLSVEKVFHAVHDFWEGQKSKAA